MTQPAPSSPPHSAPDRWDGLFEAGDLFGELTLARTAPEPAEARPRESVFQGLVICGVAAATAAWLSEHYGFPIILLGLLVGLALNFVARDPRSHAGLDFASRTCLRAGIVVLGFQVTLAQIATLGLLPFAALLVVMGLTFVAALAGAKLSGQSRFLGILAGGATAICGASAALALYGVIGKDRLSQAQFALALVGISLASALAMSIYPILATYLALNDRQAGFLIGASIHDVAQAIGGGYAFSDEAGRYATIVKLARVAMLAPLVALASLAIGSGDGPGGTTFWRRLAIPWFIAAFFGVVVLHSVVTLPQPLVAGALVASKALLLLAVTATAIRSRLDLLMEIGWAATVPVICATLASFLVAMGFALLVL